MNGESSQWRTLCDIPEDCVVVTGVEVAQYITPEGDSKWAFRCQSGADFSTVLGLLALAKHDVLREWERQGGR